MKVCHSVGPLVKKLTFIFVDQALQFSARHRSSALTAAFKTWQRNYITRQNAHAYAIQYYSTQVLDRMLLAWRLALRRRLKIAKSARKAHNNLALRRAWCVWHFQLEQRRREALLKTFEARRLKKILLGIIFVSNTFQALMWLFSRMDAARGTSTNT